MNHTVYNALSAHLDIITTFNTLPVLKELDFELSLLENRLSSRSSFSHILMIRTYENMSHTYNLSSVSMAESFRDKP